MKQVLRLVVSVALLSTAALAGPLYYTYDLGAMGVANANADNTVEGPGTWYGVWGGDVFAKTPTVNVASKINPVSPLSTDTRLENVPFSVSSGKDNVWSGKQAAISAGMNASTPDPTVNFGMSTGGVATHAVFLLMNSMWGDPTNPKVEVTLIFDGSGLDPLHYTLQGNQDIRDHNDASYALGEDIWTNQINTTARASGNGGQQVTVNEATVTKSYTYEGQTKEHRMYRDVITLFLPSSYLNRKLTGIQIRDLGPSNYDRDEHASRVLLWGVTVMGNEVPEPSTWAMIALGIGVLGWRRRSRA